MSEIRRKRKTTASPFKLALAAVLAVVLVVVLAVQFGSVLGLEEARKQKDTSSDPAAAADPGSAARAVEGPGKPSRPPQPASRWPVLRLADALEYDPFAVSEASCDPQRAAAQTLQEKPDQQQRQRLQQRQTARDRVLEKLQQEGVKAVIGTTDKGHVAVVGSQVVRVGDVLDGFRVIAIEPDGVVLEETAIR